MTNNEKIVETNLGSEAVPGDGKVTTNVIEDINKIVGSTIGGDFHRQDLITETDLSEEMNRLVGTTGKVSSAEPVDKKDTFWGMVSEHLKRNCPFKKKTTANCNVIRVC